MKKWQQRCRAHESAIGAVRLKVSRSLVAALILLLFALPAHAQEPTPAFPNHTAQRIADVASYGTLGAGLALETIDAIHCPDVSKCIWQEIFGLTVAWAGHGILSTVTHRARPCAPACGHNDPYASFPSGHAWFAGQTVWGDHKGWKAGLAIATSGLRVGANLHHTTDVTAGLLLGWGTTFVW